MSRNQLAFTLIAVVVIAGSWIAVNLYNDKNIHNDDKATPNVVGLPAADPLSANNVFSSEDLKKNLTDYSVIAASNIKTINIAAIAGGLLEVFGSRNVHQIDAAFKEFIMDSHVSRGEKLAVLMSVLTRASGDENQKYVLDVIGAFHPIEVIPELIRFFETSQSTNVKASVVATVGKALLFSPQEPLNSSNADYLNQRIVAAQNFFSSQIPNESPDIRKVALNEYVKATPQSVASGMLAQILDSSNLSLEDKVNLRANLAIADKSSIQSIMFSDLINSAATQPSSENAVRQKIIGILSASGASDILTQESRQILQTYLKNVEPTLTAEPKDMLLESSEYNSWLTALAIASETDSQKYSAWIADRVRMTDDPIKLAAILSLSADDVIKNLKRDGAATIAAAKLRLALPSLNSSAQQLISEAIGRVEK